MKDVRINYFIPLLKEEFPGLPEKKIKAILKEGLRNMMHEIVNGKDVDLDSRKVHKTRMIVFKPNYNPLKSKTEDKDE